MCYPFMENQMEKHKANEMETGVDTTVIPLAPC